MCVCVGMQHNVILEAEPWGLPLSLPLLPEYLKDVGYKTIMCGKWHLGFFEKHYTPTYRGFDEHYGYWQGYQDYYTHIVQETVRTTFYLNVLMITTFSGFFLGFIFYLLFFWRSYERYNTTVV